MSNSTILSEKTSFSESAIFSAVKEYYENKGTGAWTKSIVPTFVANNMVVANAYAQAIFAYIQDYYKKNPNNIDQEPIYIMEMCAGHGKLAHYVLKILLELLELFELPTNTICYVLTDLSKKNIESWQNHHALQQYFELGILDYAFFDAEVDKEIHLQRSNITLKKNSLKHPVMLLGNYALDTLKTDVFIVNNKNISELQVTVSRKENDNPLAELSYKYHEIPLDNDCNYYQEANFNEVLKQYKNELPTSLVLVPVGGLNAIQTIKSFSQTNFMLILSDKGHHDSYYFSRSDRPHIAEHGSISFMVNFDFIRRLFELEGGFAVMPPIPNTNFHSCLFTTSNYEESPNLRRVTDLHFAKFSPENFFQLQKVKKEEGFAKDPAYALSLLQSSLADPYLFCRLFRVINQNLPKYRGLQIDTLHKLIYQAWENYFALEEAMDLGFYAGQILLRIGDKEKAKELLEFSAENLKVNAEQAYKLLKNL